MDTLVMFCDTGDALCVDVVEPHKKPWRLFFRDSMELGELLVEAAETEGMSLESVKAVLADSLPPILAFHERHRITSEYDCDCEFRCCCPEGSSGAGLREATAEGRTSHGCESAALVL